MIYTVTVCPAIDYIVSVDNFKIGDTNRTVSEEYQVGGKGINVSRVLRELGYESVILGVIGGLTGEALESKLIEWGYNTDFVKVNQGYTRINIKLQGEDETEINGQGPEITNDQLFALSEKIKVLNDDDYIIISGNCPKSVEKDIYFKLADQLKDKKTKVIIDAAGELLTNSLPARPFLIKPNIVEFKQIVGEVSIEAGIDKLRSLGARNILLSKDKDGAELFLEDGRHYDIGIVEGEKVNTVGAGDSMVAGFIAGYIETGDFEEALIKGSAAAIATACSKGLGQRGKIEECENLLRNKFVK